MLRLHKGWKALLASIMVIVLLSGCMGEKSVLEKMPENGGKLKVMYWDEEQFYRSFGNYFSIKYQNVDFEVVSMNSMFEQNQEKENEKKDPDQRLLEFIDKEKPDVIMLSQEQISKLVEKGKLYNLDPIIAQEQVDMKDMLPGMIDMFRELGGGGLYGMAPYYYTQVVYYNADLFKKQGIDLPKHKMSWEELLNLAARFNQGSGEDQMYGIANQFSDSSQLLMNIAQASNLQVLDARGEKVLLNSDGWKHSFKLVADAIRNKAYKAAKPDSNGNYMGSDQNEFMQGKAAMALESSWYANNIVNMNRYGNNKELKPFEWGMVTMPVNPAKPDESPYISFYNIFAIHQDSPNKRLAWEFLKFMNGPEMAKAASKTISGELPTRTTYFKEISGKSAEAFTMLKPSSAAINMYRAFENNKVPQDFYGNLNTSILKAIDDIVGNKASVDEALAALQQDLQSKLDASKKKAAEQPTKK
ncbi:extracellular solute-binding protein [Paenibacillus sp. ACRRX]|uniref:ABC transporter substrate-binding protein n=1 Tax=unclassified Paenibacillus TaxID=185978 RepID=UPI001EF3E19D|nr:MULTISPECIES: extracellular solute-binding protein [unclassified Paenibacillus]MCG7410039.1 extracellular solute-binding protein [Paenibacillus sp. ACRRX]MDK8183989.1 extracellular solute-binding protein [Paenibacillus sp. UMB4589-SE434]